MIINPRTCAVCRCPQSKLYDYPHGGLICLECVRRFSVAGVLSCQIFDWKFKGFHRRGHSCVLNIEEKVKIIPITDGPPFDMSNRALIMGVSALLALILIVCAVVGLVNGVLVICSEVGLIGLAGVLYVQLGWQRERYYRYLVGQK